MQPEVNNAEPFFTAGKIYKRAVIHNHYGGNRQSGISFSAKFPFVFIFSGESGHQHGYRDKWENEDIFSYTGEGQIGDMEFVKGNLALREHLKMGRRIFLFVQTQKAFVRYEGELELYDLDFFRGPDREGKERSAIKFFFKRVGKNLNYPLEQFNLSLAADEQKEYGSNLPNETERKGLVTSRVGQGAYRKSILFRWKFKCAVTNYSKKEILIASHIVAWKDSNNEERLDVDNGILLSPTYDALFDQRLISFENNGKIILTKALLNSNYASIGVTGKESIANLSSGNIPYLERHRENID